MIRLSIKNFQSLSNVLLDVNGLTILRGESGAGKSAVIRCVRALLQNRWGSGMINNHADYCDAAVDFCDGNKLIARKAKSSAVYRMIYADGTTRDYTAMRREIPEEMGTVFGLTIMDDGTSKELLQIRGQYDRPLLIDVSHKRLSGMLGDGAEWMHCVGTDKLVKSWLTEQRGREKGLAELEDGTITRINTLESSIEKLRSLKDSVVELYSTVEDLNKKLDLFQELKKLLQMLRSLYNQKLSLSSLIVSIGVTDDTLLYLSGLRSLKTSLQKVRGIDELNTILGIIKDISIANDRILQLKLLKDVQQKISDNQFVVDDLHSRLQSDVCPVCGAKLV